MTPHPQPPTAEAPVAPSAPSSENPLRVLLPEGQDTVALPWVEVISYADDAAAEKAVIDGTCDLAALSDRAAAALIAQKALQPLPPNPDAPAPAPEFNHHYYDPAGLYTWPYGWSLLGWAAAPMPPAETPRTWKDLTREGLSLSLPADPALRTALWALAQDKPPGQAGELPAAWKNAPDALDAAIRVDFLWKLRTHLRQKDQLTLPPAGSLIALYQWAIPAAAKHPALAAEAFQQLTGPVTAAQFDEKAGLAATQEAARLLFPPPLQADPLLYPAPPLRNLCRFVR